MQNLRDKLMKAGLVSQEQAKQAEVDSSKKRERPAERPSGPDRRDRGARPASNARPPPRPPRAEAAAPIERAIPKLPPLPGSRAYQREESKKQLELDRKIRELVFATQVTPEPGAHTFYFVTRKNRLRRLGITPEFAQRLETGELAVVERPEPSQIEHSIVPAATAEQIHAFSPKSVRFLNRKDAPVGFISDDELKSRQAREAEQPEAAEAR